MNIGQTCLNDYIKVYDDVFTPERCNRIIQRFDSCKKKIYNDYYKKFAEVNMDMHSHIFLDIQEIRETLIECAEKYRVDDPWKKFMPPSLKMEIIRVKRYEPDGYFKEHTDSMNENTMMRYLSVFVYLNDSGGTDFFGNKIEAKKGRVVCFPPNWMFPHTGIVGNKPKYFMGSYFHFVE